MQVRALTWNLFHGRDAPPDPALRTWRSRLLRTTERGRTHAQVNRDLFAGFAEVLGGAEWDVALLQECPPRWAERLAEACEAQAHLVLTSRNLPIIGSLQGMVAGFNPDLIASWEGGSNLTLVRTRRPDENAITERRQMSLAGLPERRRMAFSRLAAGICVANLHASERRETAEQEVLAAAGEAVEWSGGEPLVFGGDLNIRPESSRAVFDQLEAELALAAPTSSAAIDHLLVSGRLEVEAPAAAWPPEAREIPDPTAPPDGDPLPVRLSDHAPVGAGFRLPAD